MSLRAEKREYISRIQKNKKVNIGKLKLMHHTTTLLDIFTRVPKSKLRNIFCEPLPINEESIDIKTVFYFKDSLNQELRWLSVKNIVFSEEINTYLKIKDSFEKQILFSDYEAGFHTIKKFQEEVCVSEWSLKALLLLSELRNGTAGNKEMYEYLNKKIKSPNLSLLLYYASLRYEKDITATKYQSYIQMHLSLYNQPSSMQVADYAKIELLPYYGEKDMSYDIIACYKGRLSCIDSYNGLKKIITQLLYHNIKVFNDEEIRFIISKLKESFNDPFWSKVENIITNSIHNAIYNCEYEECNKAYLNGDYKQCIKQALLFIESNPTNYDIYPIFIKSLIKEDIGISDVIKEDNLLKDILLSLEGVYLKKVDYSQCLEKLTKLSINLEIFDIGVFLYSHTLKEKTFYINDIVNISRIISSKATTLEERIQLNNESQEIEDKSLSNGYSIDNLDYLINCQRFPECIGLILNYTPNLSLYNDIELAERLVFCYYQSERFLEASQVIVNYFLKCGVIYDCLISGNLVQKIIDMDGESIYSNIEIPVLFSLYNLKSSLIYDAIANFLISNNLINPSDLINKEVSNKNKQLIIYFFDKVCTLSNLEDSPYLSTIEKVEEERIKILNYLTSIDPENSLNYNNEIFEITQRTTIRECLKNVYDSRIFVDTNNIKKLIIKEYKDNFERYLTINDYSFQDFSMFSFNLTEDNQQASQKYYAATFYLDPPISDSEYEEWARLDDGPEKDAILTNRQIIEVPYSRFLSFKEIFNVIRHHFLFNEDFGLKYFLSMRIRHGFLPNLLRSVFGKQCLLIEKGYTGERNTQFWESKILDADLHLYKESFFNAINEFSKELENITQTGVNWVKIKELENDEISIFDISFTDDVLLEYYHNLGHIKDLEKMVDESFKLLWRKVDSTLSRLKRKFEDELLEMYMTEIEKFRSKCDELFDHKPFPVLNDILATCVTEIQSVIKKVYYWFNISKNKTIKQIPINSIIDTSIEYLNIINTENFNNKIKCTIDNNFQYNIKGELFNMFGDLFNTLLGNVIKHTKNLSKTLCKVSINILPEDKISICVSNTSNKKNTEEGIDKINKMLNDKLGEYESSFEGGSGFPKIKKIISSRDINTPDYDFMVKDDGNEFITTITLPYKNIIIS